MGDYLLHSMASLGWDFQNLGVLNSSDMSFAMESGFSSTGYLEDALVEFRENSKRQRLMSYCHEQIQDYPDDFLNYYWNSNWAFSDNYGCIGNINCVNGVAGDPVSSSTSKNGDEVEITTEIKTLEEEISSPEGLHSSSSSFKSVSDKQSPYSKDSILAENGGEKRKKRVVYPFALVKPGGVEGDMTIKDINSRMLMRPTRPVKHPVGDFACRPCVSSHGPGLSGKTVVALTRIHTQGSGTITIIRTKG